MQHFTSRELATLIIAFTTIYIQAICPQSFSPVAMRSSRNRLVTMTNQSIPRTSLQRRELLRHQSCNEVRFYGDLGVNLIEAIIDRIDRFVVTTLQVLRFQPWPYIYERIFEENFGHVASRPNWRRVQRHLSRMRDELDVNVQGTVMIRCDDPEDQCQPYQFYLRQQNYYGMIYSQATPSPSINLVSANNFCTTKQ